MKRKLIKFSNYSFCITLPKKAVDVLGWKKGEEVEVTFDQKKRRISVAKKATESSAQSSASPTKQEEIKPIPKLRW